MGSPLLTNDHPERVLQPEHPKIESHPKLLREQVRPDVSPQEGSLGHQQTEKHGNSFQSDIEKDTSEGKPRLPSPDLPLQKAGRLCRPKGLPVRRNRDRERPRRRRRE